MSPGLSSWRGDRRQCSRGQQFKSHRQESKDLCPPVRRHLSLLNSPIQMLSRRIGKRRRMSCFRWLHPIQSIFFETSTREQQIKARTSSGWTTEARGYEFGFIHDVSLLFFIATFTAPFPASQSLDTKLKLFLVIMTSLSFPLILSQLLTIKHTNIRLFSITDPSQRENLGIIVHYKVKVKLCLGALGGDVVAELPFILMHPKPMEDNSLLSFGKSDDTHGDQETTIEPVDHNLIQLET